MEVLVSMKKVFRIRIILIIFIIGLMIFWIGSILKCEILTVSLKEQLINLDDGWAKNGKFKVLNLGDDYALVYWSCEYSGSTFSYIKENGEWKFNRCEKTIWSKHGSADGFIWPYIR